MRLVRDAVRQVTVVMTTSSHTADATTNVRVSPSPSSDLGAPGPSPPSPVGSVALLLQDWNSPRSLHQDDDSGIAKKEKDMNIMKGRDAEEEGVRFRVTVNDITYEHGPIPLTDGDVVLLCDPYAFTDTYRFVVHEVRHSPEEETTRRAVEDHSGLSSPPPVKKSAECGDGDPRQQEAAAYRDAVFLQECSKWSNFYNYRYSTTNCALAGDERCLSAAGGEGIAAEVYRRYIGLHPQEGCPSMLVMSYIHANALVPSNAAAPGPTAASHHNASDRHSCGCSKGCNEGGGLCLRSLCPVCCAVDQNTRDVALFNSKACLQELRERADAAVPPPPPNHNPSSSPPSSSAAAAATKPASSKSPQSTSSLPAPAADPWQSYCTERRKRLLGPGAGTRTPSSPLPRPTATGSTPSPTPGLSSAVGGVCGGVVGNTSVGVGAALPAAGLSSLLSTDAKRVCERIEQLERLMAGTRYQ